jgi:hypothetical protein
MSFIQLGLGSCPLLHLNVEGSYAIDNRILLFLCPCLITTQYFSIALDIEQNTRELAQARGEELRGNAHRAPTRTIRARTQHEGQDEDQDNSQDEGGDEGWDGTTNPS